MTFAGVRRYAAVTAHAVLLAALVACSEHGRAAPVARDGATEEGAILGAVVDSIDAATGGVLVELEPLDSTDIGWRDSAAADLLRRRLPHLQATTLAAFRAALAQRGDLRPMLGTRAHLAWSTRAAAQDSFMQWTRRRPAERTPLPFGRHLLRLSRAGIAPDGSQALVYGSVYCGNLCGFGAYYLVERQQDGTWRVTGKVVTVLS